MFFSKQTGTHAPDDGIPRVSRIKFYDAARRKRVNPSTRNEGGRLPPSLVPQKKHAAIVSSRTILSSTQSLLHRSSDAEDFNKRQRRQRDVHKQSFGEAERREGCKEEPPQSLSLSHQQFSRWLHQANSELLTDSTPSLAYKDRGYEVAETTMR